METRRFLNPSQPQTLYLGCMLLYLNAVIGLILGSSLLYFGPLIGILLLVGQGVAGFGIANEQRWGYWLGVAVSGLALVPYLLFIADGGLQVVFDPGFLIGIVFPVALFVLLIHPMSREYQRVWFS